MNFAQHYKILGNGSAVTPDMKPGMFVFDNDQIDILGFIYSVEEYSLEVVMFEPTATNDNTNVLVIAPSLPVEEVFAKLRSAISKNPKAAPIWQQYFGADFSAWIE